MSLTLGIQIASSSPFSATLNVQPLNYLEIFMEIPCNVPDTWEFHTLFQWRDVPSPDTTQVIIKLFLIVFIRA